MREARYNDIPEIVRMGKAFAQAVGEEYDVESIAQTANELIDSEIGVILIDEHAMAGALVVPNFFHKSRLIATELFWWVDKEARGNGAGQRLLNGLESWAKSKDAERLTMVGMESLDPRVGVLYKRAGYKKFETSYVRKF